MSEEKRNLAGQTSAVQVQNNGGADPDAVNFGTTASCEPTAPPIELDEILPPPEYSPVPDVPPPSYSSLYGRVKQMKSESTGPISFCKKIAEYFCSSVIVIICLALFMGIPITMIVFGSMNIHNCPAAFMVPIFLVVGGCLSVCFSLLIIVLAILEKDDEESSQQAESETRCGSCISKLATLLFFGSIGWFFAGSYFIYNSWTRRVECAVVSCPEDCDPVTYKLAFWLITPVYLLLGLAILVFCGAVVVICMQVFFCDKSEDNVETDQEHQQTSDVHHDP